MRKERGRSEEGARKEVGYRSCDPRTLDLQLPTRTYMFHFVYQYRLSYLFANTDNSLDSKVIF